MVVLVWRGGSWIIVMIDECDDDGWQGGGTMVGLMWCEGGIRLYQWWCLGVAMVLDVVEVECDGHGGLGGGSQSFLGRGRVRRKYQEF